MNSNVKTYHPAHGQPAPATLEKIPSAARRMGVSVSQFYRIARRDGLRIIKVTERASAVPQADVDAWISERINRHSVAVKAVAA
jgi:predicted DNA-binding transcriptional regulator AlpA